jgi:hypothetical protein
MPSFVTARVPRSELSGFAFLMQPCRVLPELTCDCTHPGRRDKGEGGHGGGPYAADALRAVFQAGSGAYTFGPAVSLCRTSMHAGRRTTWPAALQPGGLPRLPASV